MRNVKSDIWEWFESLDTMSPEELENYDDQETRNYWKEFRQRVYTFCAKDKIKETVEFSVFWGGLTLLVCSPFLAGMYRSGYGQYLDFRSWASEQDLLTKVEFCYRDDLSRRLCRMVQEVPGHPSEIRRFTLMEGEVE